MSRSFRFSREEWHAWRNAGWSASRIAHHLHLSISRVNQIAQQTGRTPQNDPLYHLTRPSAYRPPDVLTESGAYALGILWGTASLITSNELMIRHRDLELLAYWQHLMSLSGSIAVYSSATGPQGRYRIRQHFVVRRLKDWLNAAGWTPRQADVRPYPQVPIQDGAFIRAWIELHAAADRPPQGRQRRETPRIRIYGNQVLLTTMNDHIARASGLTPRTLQKTSNTSTKALYYTGQSARTLLQWLYREAVIFHAPAKDRLTAVL